MHPSPSASSPSCWRTNTEPSVHGSALLGHCYPSGGERLEATSERVRSTPNSWRIFASQRTAALGQQPTYSLFAISFTRPRRRRSAAYCPNSRQGASANAGALEKIAHAKTGLPRTDDDDVLHVQTTAGSIQTKPTTHTKKNAKTHEGSRHQIEAWSNVTASQLDQPSRY
jgi:hypothetical protein